MPSLADIGVFVGWWTILAWIPFLLIGASRLIYMAWNHRKKKSS